MTNRTAVQPQVGMTNDERDCKTIIYDMINDYIAAVERLNQTLA